MDDEFLVRQVVAGRTSAFRLLVLRHERVVFALLRSHGLRTEVAEEIAQDSFLRAFRALSDFNPSIGSFRTWLLSIVRNRAFSVLGRKSNQNEISDEASVLEASDETPNAEIRLMQAQEKQTVWELIQQIPKVFREALVLTTCEEMSLQEVASLQGCSVGTVKSRVFRAKDALRNAIRSKKGSL